MNVGINLYTTTQKREVINLPYNKTFCSKKSYIEMLDKYEKILIDRNCHPESICIDFQSGYMYGYRPENGEEKDLRIIKAYKEKEERFKTYMQLKAEFGVN